MDKARRDEFKAKADAAMSRFANASMALPKGEAQSEAAAAGADLAILTGALIDQIWMMSSELERISKKP